MIWKSTSMVQLRDRATRLEHQLDRLGLELITELPTIHRHDASTPFLLNAVHRKCRTPVGAERCPEAGLAQEWPAPSGDTCRRRYLHPPGGDEQPDHPDDAEYPGRQYEDGVR